ncbi:MAG: arabinose transporter permease [Chlamydiae bacterium]|nr:MAG: arabinose transporter permease [Chlamydiota bacterium]
MNRETRLTIPRIFVMIVIAVFAIMMLVPLFWLFCAAFKDKDIFSVAFWSPNASFVNFRKLLRLHPPFYRYLINSFFLASATTMVQLFFSALGGFALAKYKFKGQTIIMIVMLTTMMIPGQVLLAPLFEMISKLGLTDTYLGIIVPGSVSVFGIFLFRQSITQIPDELMQVARIDGCSEFRIFWEIILPLSRPMIGAFCLISYMGSWNSFIWPQIILHNEQRFPLTVALVQMKGVYVNEYGMMMAGTLISIIPVVILFFMLQKEFVSGLTSGAVKG